MPGFFDFGKGRAAREAKDAERNRKIEESQKTLLAAAIATADVAQDVTQNLKRKLDEIVRQFESTARILKDALVICNADGIITTFNPAAETMFGIKAKLAIRQPITILFKSRDGSDKSKAELMALLEDDDQDDVLGVHQDGSTFSVMTSFSLLDRVDGSNYLMLLIRDMTPVENCRAVEAKYQTLFETAFDGIVVVLDDGCLVAANPAVARLFGLPVAAMMGKPISDFVSPKDHDRLMACRPRAGRSANLPNHFVLEGIHSTGKLLNLVFILTPIQWDGERAMLATIRDITEMRRLEEMLAMKRDNGIDMVCSYDNSFRITFTNQTFANAFAYKRRDLIGVDIRDLMNDDERVKFENGIRQLDPARPAYRTQVKEIVDGVEVVKDWIDHVVYDDSGRTVEFQRVGRDIGKAVLNL